MDMNFEIKQYLTHPNKKVRVSFTKYLISDHDLRVERGTNGENRRESLTSPLGIEGYVEDVRPVK